MHTRKKMLLRVHIDTCNDVLFLRPLNLSLAHPLLHLHFRILFSPAAH